MIATINKAISEVRDLGYANDLSDDQLRTEIQKTAELLTNYYSEDQINDHDFAWYFHDDVRKMFGNVY